jgi:hypothetical protein
LVTLRLSFPSLPNIHPSRTSPRLYILSAALSRFFLLITLSTPIPTATMSYALSSYFPSVYRHEYVRAAKDDVCMICRSTYVTPDDSDYDDDDDGDCEAIRLTHCGHVIGDQCFHSWILRQPDTCPYWSHHLPSAINESLSKPEWVLACVCKSYWFQHFEDHNHGLFPRIPSIDEATKALFENRLGPKQAWKLFLFYVANSTLVSLVVGGFILILLCSMILGCAIVALVLKLPYYGEFQVAKTFSVVPAWMNGCFYLVLWAIAFNVLAFSGVVLGLLTLGLWKSFLNACDRLLDKVLEKFN